MIAQKTVEDAAPEISRAQVLTLLSEQIRDPGTQWSLGTFGGLAEFSRDANEAVELTTSDKGVVAVTDRGAIAITWQENLRPFASESITRHDWSHRVALCLPEQSCVMNRRDKMTELGTDADALREHDRQGVLFDIGLGAMQADLCIRVADPDAVAELRRYVGRSVFEPHNPAMGAVLAINPHRVFISRLGRIEVYQPIPPADGKSPDGPHTHVLPKLLKSRRTHPATEPVPEAWIPCAHLYPAHPAKDAMGRSQLFDRARHDTFQNLIETLGAPIAVTIKKQVTQAVSSEQPPSALGRTLDRVVRANVRVALRQMKAAGHPSRTLPAWLETFDRSERGEDDEDDGASQHGH
jgi:hypothetical protein